MTVAVEISNISKRYGYVWALKPFSTRIEEAESTSILGPNGAGKTTLLKILATQIAPSSGSIRIYGKNAFEDGIDTRMRIGFVAHESFLYDELTVEENLRFYKKFFSAGENSLTETFELLDLNHLQNVPVKQLSHGLRRRVDIARALIHGPDLILFDELFAGLDADTQNLLIDYLGTLQGKTMLISTHSPELANKLCERSLFFEKGNLVKDSSSRWKT